MLRQLTQENVMVNGAGRTDAGVHALGQVASFRTQSGLSAAEFQRALNALLPSAIRIVGAEEAGPDFHARWSALAKIYRYRFIAAKLFRRRCGVTCCTIRFLWMKTPCDAASRFVGPHDFAAFAASTGSEDDDKERYSSARFMTASSAQRRWRRTCSPCAADRSCASWFAKWWERCSMLAGETWRRRTFRACMN